MDLPSGPRGQQAQPQRAERNGVLPVTSGPGEQNGTAGYQRAFPSRTNPEKHSQRKSSLAQVEQWAKAQKGDGRRSVRASGSLLLVSVMTLYPFVLCLHPQGCLRRGKEKHTN